MTMNTEDPVATEDDDFEATMARHMDMYRSHDLTREATRALAEKNNWDFDAHTAAGHLFSYGDGPDERFLIWQFMSESTGADLGTPTPNLPMVLEPLLADSDPSNPFFWEHFIRFVNSAQVEDPATEETVQVRDWLRGGGDPELARTHAIEWA